MILDIQPHWIAARDMLKTNDDTDRKQCQDRKHIAPLDCCT